MAQFAEPVVSFLLESISKILIEEGKHLLGVSDKAQQLQSELKLMLSLVKSADQRQDEDLTLKEWISQSKDLAYEAENVLETLAFRTVSRKVGSEIEALNERISNLSRRFHEFGIRGIMQKEGPSSRQQQLMRRTYSHVEEEDFVGLENSVKILAEAVVKVEYKVISICGMGGLGKTTIARKVYHHPNIRRHFDHFAWVCISQQWQTREILVSILLKLIPEKKNDIQKCENIDILVQELYQAQQDKKCLIVLDDIWSSSAWDCMKNAFPTRGNGSKIFLTTRNKYVAIHVGENGFHHEPRLLSKDESWDLLQKRALKGRNFHVHGDIHKFEELGKEMVEYCKGLPLAVVVLGGILVTKHDFNEWEVVSKNVKFYLEKGEIIGEEVGEVQRILALSYNDLPYQLKPCFLYMGIYPEDHEIDTERLYQLWMAEGMVSEADQIGEESMMDTAERYLGELAKRSMVRVTVKEEPGIRKFRSCRLHDLMRDLCLRKGGEENFLKVIDYHSRDHSKSVNSNRSSEVMIQRLVIFSNSDDVSNYHPPKKELVKHVRSFTLSLEGDCRYRECLRKTRFKNFKMLRALTVNKVRPKVGEMNAGFIRSLLHIDDFPIGNHIHLRFLSLRDSIYATLPTSICKLQHLETLDFRYSKIFWIRDIIHRLRNLRHLYLPGSYKACPGKLQLVGLTKLEILENFDAETCHVNDLCKLTNLQVLTSELIGVEVMRCISNMPQLKEAHLTLFLTRKFFFEVSQGLELLFCSNLRHLTLIFFSNTIINGLPKFRTEFLKNLTELKLTGSQFKRDPMETLEKLPKLQRLWMVESFFGEEMTCHAMGFPQLTFLSICCLGCLKTWSVEEGAMPSLRHLVISTCHDLKMIPDGLRFIATLTELVIEEMPPEFGERVSQESEDFAKVCHVASIIVT